MAALDCQRNTSAPPGSQSSTGPELLHNVVWIC